ncbi:type IV pilus twitching motility protein PilT [Salisediminibacterium halotolerans]|uniref:type IV pilus twitching motility protein PilT n=1 Tax=Salisediminibacterium halotolerans TaxID=517425 RepID=UPI000EB53BEF|nr:type IV pilus twitching motility protein PilT [Salisediminibacterium halotolerans]RLJ78232.1 twitching motility protein PilT [Actinophytocola xinjiangensis]RPE88429.1 twitching motility protein PilT [Salisediminibacterium halotolerans]TWG37209.1 twitching motility protein PilT [Salisediminibacterium halotolerans]GEL07143.1 twitching motility protein PilT [Salisediminibacterium halotolerans]
MKETIEKLLRQAYTDGASDLHLTVGMPPVCRLHGELKTMDEPVLTPQTTESIAKTLIPEALWSSFENKGELDFSYGLRGVSRFRVNAYFQRSCISLAVRVVPTSVPTIKELGMPERLKAIAEKPQGLVLVTGPTGSGKSTTLAAMIDHMNRHLKRHIITLEDPIEYLHTHRSSIVDQREVGFDTRNFANGLRAALRQDPDVILVGEMRDRETIATAITAAETGHLVLGTLHTTDAPSTIDRIIDVFPPEQQDQIRIQLASVLSAVISQRLLLTAEGNSRTAATEMLMNTPAVRNLIRNEKIHQIPNVMQTGKAEGMHTLEMAVKELLRNGLISEETASYFSAEQGI